MAQNEKFLYRQGDRILCFHGPMIYEAKILDKDNQHPKSGNSGPHYLIHYKGWKNTWDEWVAEDRVLPINEANLRQQKQIEESMTKKNKPSTKKIVQDSSADKGKKRKRDLSLDKDDLIKKPKVVIYIPEQLRMQLVQDWESINKSQMLVPLPRKPSVTDIINNYKSWKHEKNKDSDGIAEEVSKGVCFYFNKCLGTRLLYQSERNQYKEIRSKFENLENAQIYGAEHLLRLFVIFPKLMSNTNIGEETLNALKEHLSDLLKYLDFLVFFFIFFLF
ncbi:MRG-domain-containing protein [Gigaspora rosea]|uniref:Chromatin modification-related protein EAF3 n=1 Tax=Gigaspora rosea TaxID=44941 RepID=A0A397UFC4_9GLOM|nr:MRG-domain-containing protein [Gigaspora rosea]